MSVDYFLFLKNKYEKINTYQKEICNVYNAIVEVSINEQNNSNSDEVKNIKELLTCKNEYEQKVKQTEYFIKYVTEKIKEKCKHCFIKDTIDITPDKSIEIEYCEFCECNYESS